MALRRSAVAAYHEQNSAGPAIERLWQEALTSPSLELASTIVDFAGFLGDPALVKRLIRSFDLRVYPLSQEAGQLIWKLAGLAHGLGPDSQSSLGLDSGRRVIRAERKLLAIACASLDTSGEADLLQQVLRDWASDSPDSTAVKEMIRMALTNYGFQYLPDADALVKLRAEAVTVAEANLLITVAVRNTEAPRAAATIAAIVGNGTARVSAADVQSAMWQSRAPERVHRLAGPLLEATRLVQSNVQSQELSLVALFARGPQACEDLCEVAERILRAGPEDPGDAVEVTWRGNVMEHCLRCGRTPSEFLHIAWAAIRRADWGIVGGTLAAIRRDASGYYRAGPPYSELAELLDVVSREEYSPEKNAMFGQAIRVFRQFSFPDAGIRDRFRVVALRTLPHEREELEALLR